ncbi:MAG: VPLPA-CTERM sorting domain-containing protein [Roseibium sp.]|uniref:VPLPA-CTERM sorting domain-containing protein n=1 Tax=Roseibium sp. TaxID=1936156 RepID=UPI003D9C5EC6
MRLATLAAAIVFSVSATVTQAAPVYFSGPTDTNVDGKTYTDGVVNVTVDGGTFNGSGSICLSCGVAGQYWGGLGVYSHRGDSHQVDGRNENDIVKFTFDYEVILEAVTFTYVDRKDEFSFATMDGGPLGVIARNVDIPGSGIATYTFNSIWQGTMFGIGAWDKNDNFKIKALHYSKVNVVPLPASVLLLGSAIGFAGFVSRRRKKAS